MTDRWLDEVARRLAGRGATRRALARLGFGAVVAGLALGDATEVAAACRAPKKPCEKGRQCCTGRCKQGKCAKCSNGAAFLRAPDLLCWSEWGSNGAGSGEFAFPQGVAVGGNGHVYVADTSNHRVQKFTSNGTFLATIGGRQGTVDGQFQFPRDVAVDAGGNVYVADGNNHRIQVFKPTR